MSAFLIFQKEMTEKLAEMAGVTLSNTEVHLEIYSARKLVNPLKCTRK